MFEKLFEPVQINGMIVPNRLVFEPMGNYYAELNGDASQRDCDFYAARGAGGCGLFRRVAVAFPASPVPA